MIVKYLAENGPASYEDLSKNIPLPLRTVEYGIRKILFKRFELVKKLSNDKYALKWYDEEKDVIENLKRKLLRNPQPDELAGLIKKTPEEAKAQLLLHIPGYREPTEEEITSSAKTLWKILAWGGLRLPSKKELAEKGIINVIVEGIDQETLDELFKENPSFFLAEANNYLKDFSGLKPTKVCLKKGKSIIYKMQWSDEAKRMMHNINLWKATACCEIPFKYITEKSEKPFGGEDIGASLEIAEKLAEIYSPSQYVIDFLLKWSVKDHGDCNVLGTMKQFIKNGLEVGQLDEKIKERIASELANAAFIFYLNEYTSNLYFSKDNNERNIALDIIDVIDVRDETAVSIAMDYVREQLGIIELSPDDKPTRGPDIDKVVKWLAKDAILLEELTNEIDKLMKEANEIWQVDLCKRLLEIIREISLDL